MKLFFYKGIGSFLAILGLVVGFSSKVIAQYGAPPSAFRINGMITSEVCHTSINKVQVIVKSDFPDSNGVFIDSFLDVFAFNMQWRFAEADTLLQQYLDKYNSQSTADILKIEAKNIYHHVPKKKSVKKARILAVIPGLGHAYSGYYTEGLGISSAIIKISSIFFMVISVSLLS